MAGYGACMATRWGILGPGRIAHSFSQDLRLVPDAELTAVGSRSHARAEAFAQEHGFAAAYGSYEELLADESVDAVYVASPHALHVEHVTAALEAGKHVLCEKPVTLRAADAEELFALAVRSERLMMEAMWTACHPVVRAVVHDLGAGAVALDGLDVIDQRVAADHAAAVDDGHPRAECFADPVCLLVIRGQPPARSSRSCPPPWWRSRWLCRPPGSVRASASSHSWFCHSCSWSASPPTSGCWRLTSRTPGSSSG